MKANKFFLGLALIGAILTGCENKEPETPEGNGIKADAYVSVKISMASTVGTRATEDGGFAEGSAAEQVIDATKSIFLFYDSVGNWITSGQLATSSSLNNDSLLERGSVDIINSNYADAYVVLSGPDVELKKSRKVLTVVNYSNCESLKQLSLLEALEKVTTEADDPANGFLMTTSVYLNDNDSIINTSDITANNIQTSVGQANANPVAIFIERAAAKARLSLKDGVQDTELDSINGIVLDGALKGVKIHVNSWNLNNVYESTYLVKQLDPTWIRATGTGTVPFAGWNWTEAKRSYWAKGHNWDGTGSGSKKVRSYAEANIALGDSTFCYENTVENPVCSAGVANPNVNTVLIAAQFKVKGAADYQNLYRYSGVFYTENTYKDLILKQIKDEGYVKASDMGDLTRSDISIISDGTTLAGVKFTVKGQEYKKYNSITEQYDDINDATIPDSVNVATFVNGLAYVTQTVGYANGKCYYQIPVEHLGAVGTAAQYGMVRNHFYQIKVNSINRIGEPVFDETEDIPGIPEKTTEHYLSAQIHVLSWHVVNQNVDL